MGRISVLRSIAVIIAGLLLLAFIDQTLERTLVMAIAQAPITGVPEYLAIRDRTGVLAIIIVTHGLAALLTGYVIGRLSGTHEVHHAAITAALATLLLISASASPNVMVPPAWTRFAMAALTAPAPSVPPSK